MDIRSIQELLGHADVRTTKIWIGGIKFDHGLLEGDDRAQQRFAIRALPVDCNADYASSAA